MVHDILACLILWNIFKNITDFKHVLTTVNDFLSIIRPVRPVKSGKGIEINTVLSAQLKVPLLYLVSTIFFNWLSGSAS